MADVTTKGKRIFWMMILTAFIFAAVPSLVVIEKAEEYYTFLSGWNPRPLKPSKVSSMPHPRRRHNPYSPPSALDVRFVEFQLQAPGAKEVHLAASFNGWKRDSLSLSKETGGRWNILVPLPPGTYYYGFDVDGTWTPDTIAVERLEKAGRDVSVREVR